MFVDVAGEFSNCSEISRNRYQNEEPGIEKYAHRLCRPFEHGLILPHSGGGEADVQGATDSPMFVS
jgi:hypothetical protein